MDFKFSIGSFIVFSFLAACSSKEDGGDRVGLIKILEKHFEIDTITNLKSRYLDIYETDTSTFLVYENGFKPSVQFYDTKAEKLAFEVDLIQSGPNGVGTINGCYVKSLDSIYLLNISDMRIFLINRNGEVKKYFSFLKPTKQFPFESMSSPMIISGSPAIYYKKMLQMVALPGMGPTRKETFDSGKVNLAINISTGDYYLNFGYPDIYRHKKFGNFWGKIFRAKTHDERIIYSFAADKNIQLTDYITTTEHFAGSSFFADPTPYEDVSKMRSNNFTSTMYGGIFYDKYRKLYYRIVTGALEKPDQLAIDRGVYDSKPMSVIILNLKFEKIGETVLPLKTHDPTGVCVGPEGLYISNSNLENPQLRENILSFSIYAVKILTERNK